jgi:hypothetical protein
MTSTAAAVLMDRLGLSEDELCAVLGVDPLTVIAGDLDDKPQLPILLALTGEAAERVGEDVLRRWLRATGPGGRPLDHLLASDYAAFEDDLATLAERGLVLRGGGPSGGAGGRGDAGGGGEGDRRSGSRGASGNAEGGASGGGVSDGEPRDAEADGDAPDRGPDAGAP